MGRRQANRTVSEASVTPFLTHDARADDEALVSGGITNNVTAYADLGPQRRMVDPPPRPERSPQNCLCLQ